jgi:fimbrial isopeptide formation D2 family protein/LPXTG-motif cell wall-anchored protein
MNGRRRLWAHLALALSLVATLVGTVLLAPREARAEEYTITVTDTKSGSSYSAYKIFDVVYSGSNYAYSISSDNPFYQAVVNSNLFNLEQTSATGVSPAVYSVVMKDSTITDNASFAEMLRTAMFGSGFSASAAATEAASGTSVSLTVADPGYYFVTTTTGTICSLDTTSPTAEVRDKNSTPSIDKYVRELEHNVGTNGFVKQNDASIGDEVQFCIKVTIVEGAVNYVVHDTLSTGLTLNPDSFKYGTELNYDTAQTYENIPDDYKVAGGITVATSGQSFTVTLSNDLHAKFLGTGTSSRVASRDFYIFYTATLNSSAVVGSTGNPNETWLTYGTGSDIESEHVKTRTYTWPITVVKYTGSDTSTNHLAGAVFTLRKATVSGSTWTAGNAVSFVQSGSDTNYTASTASGAVTTITTTSTGTITLSGIDSGTYLLEEVTAPDGYNKLANPIRVTITANPDNAAMTATVTYEYVSTSGSNSGSVTAGTGDAASTVYVQNTSSPLLPTTGGAGTMLLYLVGGVMVAVAAGALVARRRAS